MIPFVSAIPAAKGASVTSACALSSPASCHSRPPDWQRANSSLPASLFLIMPLPWRSALGMVGMPDFMQVGVLNDVSGMTGCSSILIPVPVRRRVCNRGVVCFVKTAIKWDELRCKRCGALGQKMEAA